MRSRRLVSVAAIALVATLGLPAGGAAAQEPGGRDRVEVYVGTVNPEQFELLRGIGVDPEDMVKGADGTATQVEVPLTERQAARLASKGVKLSVKTIDGKASSQLMREQAAPLPEEREARHHRPHPAGPAHPRGQGHQGREAHPRRCPAGHRLRGGPARP